MQKIRGYFATLSIAIGLACIIIAMFFYKKKNNARNIRKYCALFFPVNFIRMERIGEYDLDARLIIANHQSACDIICLEGDHPLNICWVAKKQLGDLPFYGYALKLPQMIFVDREDKSGIVQLLREAKERLAQDRPIVIFPEGTRGPGTKMFLPFKQGGKILAQKLRLKIQPIVFVNTRKVYDSKPISTKKSLTRVVCMPAFTPDFDNDEMWYEKLKQDMFDVYCKHYDELNPEELESENNTQAQSV